LGGEHIPRRDRREVLELLLAMDDVAPILHPERLRRRLRLVEERAEQCRWRENARKTHLRGVIRVAIDRVRIADRVGEFADLAALDVEFVGRERLSGCTCVHALPRQSWLRRSTTRFALIDCSWS